MNLLSEPLAAKLAAILLDAAVKGMVVLTLAALAMRFMKGCSAAARHLAVFSCLGSLLVLPLLSSALPHLDLLPAWSSVGSLGSTRTSGANGWERPPQFVDAGEKPALQTVSSPVQLAQLVRIPGQPALTEKWTASIMAVWLSGVCCVLISTAAGLCSLWRLQRASLNADQGPLLELLHKLQEKYRVRRKILLLMSANRRMPMTWSVLLPKILLPEESLDWPESRQKVVLLHELAHIQRFDFLTTLATRFVCAIYWFNPLVWMAARWIGSEQEKACDDVVISEGAGHASYAEEVLQIAAGRPMDEAFGAVAMARPSSLEGRLLAILDRTRNRNALSGIGAFLTALLLACAIIPMSMLRAQDVAAQGRDEPLGNAQLLERGLVGWWRGEGSGMDSAGNHHGTFPFGEKYVRGLIGQAFDFRRTYEIARQLLRVSIPDSPAFELSEAMTLEAWVFPLQYEGVILLRGDDRPGFETWHINLMTEGRVSYSFNTAENQGTGVSAPIQLNQWQHVAAVFDHGAMMLYINGALAAESRTDLRPVAVLDPRHNPALGIGNAGGTVYNMPFDGLIDEVRIYNRALSEAEIGQDLK